MTDVITAGQVGVQTVTGIGARFKQGRQAEQVVSELHGRYYTQAYDGSLFVAHAIVTAPVIYSTAAGTGGPLIWNPPGSGINVVPVALGYGVTVVTTVAAALGLTGNVGQVVAPGSVTAIDSKTQAIIGGGTGKATAYRIGTPTNAGGFFLPLADLHTGALTVNTGAINWVDVGGVLICPPGGWISVAASATASTTVAQLALVYEEVPV